MQRPFYRRSNRRHEHFEEPDQGTWLLPGEEDRYFRDKSKHYRNQPHAAGPIGGFRSPRVRHLPHYEPDLLPMGRSHYEPDLPPMRRPHYEPDLHPIGSSRVKPNKWDMHDRSFHENMPYGSEDDADSDYYRLPNETYLPDLGRKMRGGMIRHFEPDNRPIVPRNFRPDDVRMNGREMDLREKIANTPFQSQLIAAAAMGIEALAKLHNAGSNSMFNFDGENFGSKKRKGPRSEDLTEDQPYIGNSFTVTLNATNHNLWCFLRKGFNKRDNELAEHIFEIHEKFCDHCRERLENRKLGKKKKAAQDDKAEKPVVQKKPEENQNKEEEEEQDMEKLMGFGGFRTTKGKGTQDGSFKGMASINPSGSTVPVEESTGLTEEEKKMILLRGGFSVFSRVDCSDDVDSEEPDMEAAAEKE